MGPSWGRQDPDWPYVGPMNFAVWAVIRDLRKHSDCTATTQIQWYYCANAQRFIATISRIMTFFVKLKQSCSVATNTHHGYTANTQQYRDSNGHNNLLSNERPIPAVIAINWNTIGFFTLDLIYILLRLEQDFILNKWIYCSDISSCLVFRYDYLSPLLISQTNDHKIYM